MPATSTLFGSGTPTTSGTTWTNAANAAGANDGAFATRTTATNGAVGYIQVTGFGAQAAIGSQPDSVDSVDVTVWHYVQHTGRWTSVSVQLTVSGTLIGSAQNATLSATTTNSQTFTFTGVSWAQLANLGVRVSSTKNGTQSSTHNVDAVGVVVNYTVAVPALVTPSTVAAPGASIPTPTAGRTYSLAGTSGTVTGLATGQQYTARVRAVDAAGNRSAWSDPLIFTTSTGTGATSSPATVAGAAAIPAPSISGASSATRNPATVAGSASVPAPTVRVGATRAPATVAGSASIPTPVAGTIRTFTFAGTSGQVTGLTGGTTYTARVRARDAAGNWSAYSAPITITTNGAGSVSPATVAATATIPAVNGGGAPPTVVAGLARPVLAGGSVLLDVTATPPSGGSVASHSWAIISGGGSLTNATTATPTYTAPASGSGLVTIRDTVTAAGGGSASADVTVSYHSTIVAAENALTGTARATWDLASPNLGGIDTLQGFCDGFTANRDETVSFKVAQSDGAGWSAAVYRLGWYGGNGARFFGTLTPTSGQLSASQSQPAPGDADPNTTMLSADCGNWSTTLTWSPPAWAPSGMYVLRLNRTGGGASHVLFILRDDARSADLMLMPSDATWNAYNAWGGMGASMYAGNSLYLGTAVNQYASDCARFVSYNRPVVNRGAADAGRSYGAVEWSTFFTGEYPAVRFLERNGIDVKYYGCIDAAGDPTGSKLANVGAAMAVGHNEYWSDGMRSGWEQAKASGTNLFFCAANEVFWRLVGSNNDASGRPRLWECFKSTIASRASTGRPQWTGTWRDPDGAGKGGNQPENTLTGTIFVVNGPDLRSIAVPFNGGFSQQPIWRHTSVASLTAGQSWTSPSQILGFEWDTYGPAGVNTTGANFLAAPHPRARYCSDVTYNVSLEWVLSDAGDEYTTGTVTHRMVVHPGGAGGMVFGTGTINWAFGLDNANTYQTGNDNTSSVIQQATVNMLTDMGASPATLMAGLTQSTPVDWYEDVLPGTVTAAASIPAPTVVATSSATRAPATVAAAAAVPTPTVVTAASATRSPATVAAVAAVASPTVTATSNATRSPATVTATASVPAPTITAGTSATRSPATVTAAAAVAQPAIVTTGSATAQPVTVAAVASVATPARSTAWRVNPATVTASTTVPAPAVRVSQALTLTTVAGVAAIASPTLVAQAHATRAPATVMALASVPVPTVTTWSKLVYRPYGGTTARPDTGTTARPYTGVTNRP